MKKITLALLATTLCCTAGLVPSDRSHARANRVDTVAPARTNDDDVRDAPGPTTGRPSQRDQARGLSATDVVFLVLAAGGAFAVWVAGFLLLAGRGRRRGDGSYWLLGAIGFVMLISAVIGLMPVIW